MQDISRWVESHTPPERRTGEMECCGSLVPVSQGDRRPRGMIIVGGERVQVLTVLMVQTACL